MKQCGVLPKFKGIAMHDCWASYWNYPDIQHAVYCAHLLRELTEIDENHPEQKWASAFIDLLLEMKKAKDKAVEKGKDSLSYYHYHKFDICLFIDNFNVPFDNNQAERDLRMIKVKTKVSGCFRTEEGARDYLKIMFYVGTAHKQGYNAYEAIKNAITGHPDFIFE